MLRSVLIGVAVSLFCALQTGCCCCTDFMKGFKQGFEKGLKQGQQRNNPPPGPGPDQQNDEAKRRADLQKLRADSLKGNTYGGSLAPGSPFWGKLRQTISQKRYVTNPMMGDGPEKPFSDVHPDGGVLIGFLAGEGDGDHLSFLQPIYLTSLGEKAGQEIGQPRRPVQVLKARPGYAVGGATIRKGAIIDAITVTFMRVEGEKLNPADRYDSPQVGGQGGGPLTFLTKGPFLVGIHGRQNENDGFSPKDAPNCLGFYSLP
jgi:hypothetical protein